jgi:hypothetical protein
VLTVVGVMTVIAALALFFYCDSTGSEPTFSSRERKRLGPRHITGFAHEGG